MKFVYRDMGHIISFEGGYVNELTVENKRMFFEMVSSITAQAEGGRGNCVLSISDKPVEFSKYAEPILLFTPFQINRKNLLTKLYSLMEKNALTAKNYMKTSEMLSGLESYMLQLAEELPFEVECKKLAIGNVIRALAPEIEEDGKSSLEKIFAYMEFIRELDCDKLFITVNMRTYFDDEAMENFIESVSLHDFKLLLLENSSGKILKNTKRFTIDSDLCEF